MPILVKIIIILCLFTVSHGLTSAETISLGSAFPSAENNAMIQDISLKVSGASYALSKNDILGWTKEKNDLVFNEKYVSEIENSDFCAYKKSLLCKLTFDIKNEKHIQKSSSLSMDTDSINSFVEDLSRKVNKDPVSAKLTITDGKVSVFSLSQKGIELDKEKSKLVLIDYFKRLKAESEINLPYLEKEPEVSTDSIDNLGITSLIGEGRSNFRGSPRNRIFNIKVATNRFNGAIIKPGEEFSFVKILGEVDGEHGYLPELVIKNDKTEPEFGGGICQVSTTAFRAAIYSGLPITARRNHSYPVAYYNPQGMDASVYVPRPDLRFINDTPGHILIQTEIVGTELIFRFFGTSDGRKVNVVGPTILEKNPDGSMKTVFTQQIMDANGNMLKEDVFNSSYDSPNNYPHPGEVLTTKPKNWSDNEWSKYKKENKIP